MNFTLETRGTQQSKQSTEGQRDSKSTVPVALEGTIWTSPKGYRWEINTGFKYASNGRNLRHSGDVKLSRPNDKSNN